MWIENFKLPHIILENAKKINVEQILEVWVCLQPLSYLPFTSILTNSIAYETWRSNAAFTKALIRPILRRINPIPRIDTYFFKSILMLSSHLRIGVSEGLFPVSLPVKIESTLIFLHSVYMIYPSQPSRFNRSDCIRWMVQTMKFPFVKAFPLSFPSLLGSGVAM